MKYKICIGVPTFNRPEYLPRLFDSVLPQFDVSCELLVVDNYSPRSSEIKDIVDRYARCYSRFCVRYLRNESNLGYDGNVRQVLHHSEGEMTFFVGDDDVLRPGAIARLSDVLRKAGPLGVVIGSRENFSGSPDNVTSVFRYFPTDRYFCPGVDTIVTFYRRSAAITGFVVNTEAARSIATTKFDGTLEYQFHLTAQILNRLPAYYITSVLSAMCRGDGQGRSFIGAASAERVHNHSGQFTWRRSLAMVTGMLRIARCTEKDLGISFEERVLMDIGSYSYSYLRAYSDSRRELVAYGIELAKIGLWKSGLFWLYFVYLFCLSGYISDRIIVYLKRLLGRTPRLGRFSEGVSV